MSECGLNGLRTPATWLVEEFDEAGDLFIRVSACDDHALGYLVGDRGYDGLARWPMTWHGERFVLTRLHPEAS